MGAEHRSRQKAAQKYQTHTNTFDFMNFWGFGHMPSEKLWKMWGNCRDLQKLWIWKLIHSYWRGLVKIS